MIAFIRLPLALILLASCTAVRPTYSVSVESGVTVSRSVDDVAAIAVARLTAMAQEQGLVSDGIEITDISAGRSGAPTSALDAGATIWTVRMNGPFYTNRVGPGAAAIHAHTGAFQIDDATGQIIGMGMGMP